MLHQVRPKHCEATRSPHTLPLTCTTDISFDPPTVSPYAGQCSPSGKGRQVVAQAQKHSCLLVLYGRWRFSLHRGNSPGGFSAGLNSFCPGSAVPGELSGPKNTSLCVVYMPDSFRMAGGVKGEMTVWKVSHQIYYPSYWLSRKHLPVHTHSATRIPHPCVGQVYVLPEGRNRMKSLIMWLMWTLQLLYILIYFNTAKTESLAESSLVGRHFWCTSSYRLPTQASH